jgi:hypothetical protein
MLERLQMNLSSSLALKTRQWKLTATQSVKKLAAFMEQGGLLSCSATDRHNQSLSQLNVMHLLRLYFNIILSTHKFLWWSSLLDLLYNFVSIYNVPYVIRVVPMLSSQMKSPFSKNGRRIKNYEVDLLPCRLCSTHFSEEHIKAIVRVPPNEAYHRSSR